MAENKNAVTDDDYAKAVFEDGSSLIVDLSGIQEMKFEAVPKGIYDAEVDSCEYQISKNSNQPMFQFVFQITDGPYQGRKLYFYTSFSQKALPGTKTALLRIDPTLFSGPFEPQKIAATGQLLGKKLRIKVTLEDYQGEQRSRVQAVFQPAENSAGGGGDGFFS